MQLKTLPEKLAAVQTLAIVEKHAFRALLQSELLNDCDVKTALRGHLQAAMDSAAEARAAIQTDWPDLPEFRCAELLEAQRKETC